MIKKILIALLLIILAVGGYSVYRISIKTQTTRQIEDAIESKGYNDFISEKKVVYDSKRGSYYVEVIYKDEDKHTYNYDINDDKVFTYVLDESNVEITELDNLKYLINE